MAILHIQPGPCRVRAHPGEHLPDVVGGPVPRDDQQLVAGGHSLHAGPADRLPPVLPSLPSHLPSRGLGGRVRPGQRPHRHHCPQLEGGLSHTEAEIEVSGICQ